eukprot:CAMPEP_0113616466 /NCGR_PEP_ID=MMETSP0017_2-20120614/8254_1 /TAXON_ID=2856 /ORGANISM="Cylindrotheca closterium" /LENGTH=130 /DNA_ID=CAMNT_0000525781 /DNA_START=8 /DNA_END=398 /DNA_ORIENTATION=- /assembly_acc=CAM_ASM_000147
MCPVNVHWHLGTEHLSVGEYDEMGAGPHTKPGDMRRKLAAGEKVRGGFRCHHYDENDAKFTTEYDWQHCVGMEVGETYEVHWPHSAAGAAEPSTNTKPHSMMVSFAASEFLATFPVFPTKSVSKAKSSPL